MAWLTTPSWQGISGIATIATLIIALVPYLRRKQRQKNHAAAVVERFISLFKEHGIERTQIPRFLGENFDISVADVSTDERLLHVLNEKILNAVCDRFGVRRGWMDGVDKRVYELLYHYKNLPDYVNFVKTITEKHPDEFCLLYAYKPANSSSNLFKSYPDISLVFAEPIAAIDQQTIYRYYPFYGPFPWDHSPARFNLYAFFTLALSTHGLALKGCEVSPKYINEISLGNIIPEAIKNEGIWHPDDYAYSSINHKMPMDSNEIGEFWNYIDEKDWLVFFDKNIISRPL